MFLRCWIQSHTTPKIANLADRWHSSGSECHTSQAANNMVGRKTKTQNLITEDPECSTLGFTRTSLGSQIKSYVFVSCIGVQAREAPQKRMNTHYSMYCTHVQAGALQGTQSKHSLQFETP